MGGTTCWQYVVTRSEKIWKLAQDEKSCNFFKQLTTDEFSDFNGARNQTEIFLKTIW